MPDPTLLSDITAPQWQALTAEQRTCWHYFAAANPIITNDGDLTTLYGWQEYNSRNAVLNILPVPAPLSDPPTDLAPPTPPDIEGVAWPHTARIAGTTTAQNGYAYAQLQQPIPAGTALIVTQGYTRQKRNPRKIAGVRHVRVSLEGDSQTINLVTPNGYYAETAGNTRFAKIKGLTARRRTDLPLGKLRVIRLDNGEETVIVISNPNGKVTSGVTRPLHFP